MKKRNSSSLLNNSLYAIACFGLFIFKPVSAWAQQPLNNYHGSHMMWNGGWYGMIFGPFLMLLFIGIIIAVIVLIVRWLGDTTSKHATPTHSTKDPLDILKERFAHGEIEKEEYEERRRILRE